MKLTFEPDGETIIEYEVGGLNNRDCVKVTFPVGVVIVLRLPLSEAETLGEGLIKCVRAIEAREQPSD